MSVRSAFPHEIRVVDPLWIELSDGARLCARMWLPVDADERPVPAILEAIPYRRGDVAAADDALRHPYVAGHGYATVRVDLRGSGDSDGVLLDEYHRQEQDDLVEVIAWLAAQPWCTGDVGMTGISWSGFNSLQVAARRPPALKAIITACSTDDRYDNDVHYYGGVPLGYYLMPWANVMLAFNARPPDPAVVGDRWREIWRERLEGNLDLSHTWVGHQHRDEYWRGGSICEDYGAIDCAVLAVGGWADAYVDAILRMLEHLDCPRRALVGPWGHLWPEAGIPGPAIGFLQEAVRWWDHWLKGADNGAMDEPLLRAWMQDAVAPDEHDMRPGRWVAEPVWPPADAAAREVTLTLGGDDGTSLGGPAAPAQRLAHRSPTTVGLDAGAWCPYGNPGDLPPDQRAEDARSLTFTSAPLDAPLELLGRPELDLVVACDQPRGFVMARLCDVAPDGASTLITRGALNLCHRDGRAEPVAIEPGVDMHVTVGMKATGYAVPAGHRLRVSLSTAYWPWLWPSPQDATITVTTGAGSALRLPGRARQPGDDTLRPFDAPETAPPLAVEQVVAKAPVLRTSHDALTGLVTLEMAREFTGGVRFADGLEHHDHDPVVFSIVDGDPLSAKAECRRRIDLRRGAWHTAIEVLSTMTADAEHFHVSSVVDAYEGATRIHTAAYSRSIPRHLV